MAGLVGMSKSGEIVDNMQFCHTSENALFLQKARDLQQKGHYQLSHDAYFAGENS